MDASSSISPANWVKTEALRRGSYRLLENRKQQCACGRVSHCHLPSIRLHVWAAPRRGRAAAGVAGSGPAAGSHSHGPHTQRHRQAVLSAAPPTPSCTLPGHSDHRRQFQWLSRATLATLQIHSGGRQAAEWQHHNYCCRRGKTQQVNLLSQVQLQQKLTYGVLLSGMNSRVWRRCPRTSTCFRSKTLTSSPKRQKESQWKLVAVSPAKMNDVAKHSSTKISLPIAGITPPPPEKCTLKPRQIITPCYRGLQRVTQLSWKRQGSRCIKREHSKTIKCSKRVCFPLKCPIFKRNLNPSSHFLLSSYAEDSMRACLTSMSLPINLTYHPTRQCPLGWVKILYSNSTLCTDFTTMY